MFDATDNHVTIERRAKFLMCRCTINTIVSILVIEIIVDLDFSCQIFVPQLGRRGRRNSSSQSELPCIILSL